MQEVSKEEFYKFIGVRDVVCSSSGRYPYKTDFKDRGANFPVATITPENKYLIHADKRK